MKVTVCVCVFVFRVHLHHVMKLVIISVRKTLGIIGKTVDIRAIVMLTAHMFVHLTLHSDT